MPEPEEDPSPESDPSHEDVSKGNGCRNFCWYVKFVFTVWILIWQYNVISQYANRMPMALFDGNHVPMTEECTAIYFALQRSLLCTILEYMLPVIMSFLMFCCLPLCLHIAITSGNMALIQLYTYLSMVSFCAICCIIPIGYVVVPTMGIIAVARADKTGTAECRNLDSCAWYVFIWLLLFQCWFHVCCGLPTMPMMPNEALPDHYKALEVSGDADQATIKAAWRKLQMQYHPDKVKARTENPEEIAEAEARTRQINAAWEVLQVESKRAKYDQDRETQRLLGQRNATQRSEP